VLHLTQVSYADCCEIVAACKSAGVILAVCHVLRYTPQARKIAKLIQSGIIGDVVSIQHLEPVSSSTCIASSPVLNILQFVVCYLFCFCMLSCQI